MSKFITMDSAYWESLYKIKDAKEFNMWHCWAVFVATGDIIDDNGRVIKSLSAENSPPVGLSPPSARPSSAYAQPARPIRPIPRSTTPLGEPPCPPLFRGPAIPLPPARKVVKRPEVVGWVGWSPDYDLQRKPSSSKKRCADDVHGGGDSKQKKRPKVGTTANVSRGSSASKSSTSPPLYAQPTIPNDQKQTISLVDAKAIAEFSKFLSAYRRD